MQDTESLEKRIISDQNLEADLLEAEDDLIEDYLEGNLSNDELKAFNENFLVTDDRLESVELVKSLRHNFTQNTENKEVKSSFLERIKVFVSLRPFTFATASLALILGLGFVWIMVRSTPNIDNAELVAINNQDLSNLETLKDYKKISLVSGNLRSGGNNNGLTEKDLTERILMQLILPNKTDSTQNFTVKISKDGQIKQTFTQKSYEKEVRILIPKSMLTKGEHQVTLEKDSEKYNYYFAVE